MALPPRPSGNGPLQRPAITPPTSTSPNGDTSEVLDPLIDVPDGMRVLSSDPLPSPLLEDKPSGNEFEQDWMDDGIPFEFDPEKLSSLNKSGEEREDWEDIRDNDQPQEAIESIRYAALGKLSADDVINNDYDKHYAHLEEKVEKMTAIIREILNDTGRSEDIATAREKRGPLYAELTTEVDRLVLRQLSDPTSKAAKTGATIGGESPEVFLAMVVNELLGYGPIEPLWQDKTISEIMINGPRDIRIEQKGKTVTTKGIRFRSSKHLLEVTRQMIGRMGRRLDTTHPMVDASLSDGSRINAVHEDLAPGGPLLTIRRFPDTVFSVRKMVEFGSMTEQMAVEIGNLIYMGCSTIIAGGTGTGKALSTATRIPTPQGVKLLGDLQVGDQVFDENGVPTTVTGYFPQEPNRECFEVVFSDGSTVIADADHNWSFFQNGEWSVKTTLEARDVLLAEAKAHKATTLTIPVLSSPVVWDRQEGAVDAYQVGYDTGTDNNLVVPQAVVYGSVEARKAFLEGFLEASLDDGRAVAHSTGLMAVRVSNLKNLEVVNFIINSLGDTQAFIESYENIESSIYFYLPEGVCTNIDRRADEEYLTEKNTRTIVDICPVDSVPVACISVDSPNSLYLFGDSFIPTHNTSMLNALSGCIPDHDRVITIEDTPELQLNPNKHVVKMVSRPGSGGTKKGEKDDGITIRHLVRNALRMRPDRIVVGEVRDSSAYDMMQAMNTGHEGSLTTVHANDAPGTVERISLLVSESAEVTADRAITLVAGGVDLFILIGRYEDGSRRVAGVHEVPSRLTTVNGKDTLETIPLFEFVHDSTDKDGKVHGHYEKINDVSESLVRKHRLDKKKRLTLEDLYALSDVEMHASSPEAPNKQQDATTEQQDDLSVGHVLRSIEKSPGRSGNEGRELTQ